MDGHQKTLLQPCDFASPMVPIGRGKDSVIYAAYCAKLGGQVAVKVYQKSRTSASKLRAIKREAAMMVYLSKKSVPNITAYHGAFQTQNEICIVMEYCPRGDLLEQLLSEGRAFSEPRVAEVAAALLVTLQRMHALHIIHRDVKLENIFIGGAGELKLGDFGLTMSMKQETAISPVGTVEYMAPEVVALPRVELVASGAVDPASIAPCDTGVDVWALGITVYELLSGHLPFDGRDKAHTKRAITAGDMRPLPASVSAEACEFVAAMLEPDRCARPTAADLLQHPFLARSACGSPRSVLPPIADALAYIQAETSPWPTKGGTACSEIPSQHAKIGALKLSIPESPDQLRDSPRCGSRHQLVTPVAFWNSDATTPDAAPDGQLIRACYGRHELPTPLYPAASPLQGGSECSDGTPVLFGGFGGIFGSGGGGIIGEPAGDYASAPSSVASDSGSSGPDSPCSPQPIFAFEALRQAGACPARIGGGGGCGKVPHSPQDHYQQQQSPPAAPPPSWGAKATPPPPWKLAAQAPQQDQPHQQQAQQQQQQQQRHSPSRLSYSSSGGAAAALRSAGSSGSLLAPYSPAAAGPDPSPAEDEEMLSWRHGGSHQEGLPWSAGRLLQRLGFFFRPTAAVR